MGWSGPSLLSHLTGPIPCFRSAETKSLIVLLDAEARGSTAEDLGGELQFTRIHTVYFCVIPGCHQYWLHHIEAQASPICHAKQLSTLNSGEMRAFPSLVDLPEIPDTLDDEFLGYPGLLHENSGSYQGFR